MLVEPGDETPAVGDARPGPGGGAPRPAARRRTAARSGPVARPRRASTSGAALRPPRWANRGWLVAAGALLTWAFVVALRVWLPSLMHVLGDATGASALARGGVAAAWFLPAAVVLLAFPRLGPLFVWRVAIGTLVAARVALQFTAGGTPQLAVSGVAVAAGAIALVAFAAGSPSGHLARVGVVLGLGLESAVHATFGTYDLVWRGGVVAALSTVGFGILVLLVAERAARVPLWWPTPLDGSGALSAVWTRGAAWSWLGVGPALALVGILASPPARLEIAGGVGAPVSVFLLFLAAAAAFAAAALAPVLGARVSGRLAAVLVLATTAGALRPEGLSSLAAQLLLPVGVGFALGAPTTPRDDGPRRRGAAATASLLLFVAITFVYYAAYEVPLRVSNEVVLLGAAAVVAGLAFAAAQDPRQLRPSRGAPLRTVALTTAAVVAVGAVVAGLVPRAEGSTPGVGDGSSIRVATFNARSGFDAAGRFDPDLLADAVVASGADVIVLNEIDRGWLLEGGHDLLRLLADRTGTSATFAPGADELRGNAVLSRLPVTESRVVPLPRGGTAMARSLASVVVDAGGDARVAIIGTQLHGGRGETLPRLTQARAVTAEVARLRGRGLPVAVLGDLGAERDAPELAPLTLLDEAVPDGGPTWPAAAPVLRRDHVLVSPDLTPIDPGDPTDRGSGGGTGGDGVSSRSASDHLPVIVTLELPQAATSPP